MKRSRKQARRQTFRQTAKQRHGRLVLYHGTNAKAARSIRNTGLNPALRIPGRTFKQTVTTTRIRASYPHNKVITIRLSPIAQKKYLTGRYNVGLGLPKKSEYLDKKLNVAFDRVIPKSDINYALSHRIPTRYIDKRKRGR